jgi:hypothetical protein
VTSQKKLAVACGRRVARGCAWVHDLGNNLEVLGFFRDFLGAARPVPPLVRSAPFPLASVFAVRLPGQDASL